MPKFILVSILGIILILFSCKKNSIPNTHYTPKIKEILFKPPGFPNGANRVDFYYDNTDRVTNISIIYLVNNDTLCTIDFNYLGSSRLPFMALKNDRLYLEISRHFYFYNTNNNLIKDSVIIPSCCTNVYSYSYSGNYTISTYGTNQSIDSIHILNKNIVTFSRTMSTPLFSCIAEYDNQINPLHNLNIVPVVQTVCLERNPFQPYWPIWSFNNANNITKHTWNRYNQTPTINSYSNIYNSSGVLIKSIPNSTSQIYNDTGFYKYY